MRVAVGAAGMLSRAYHKGEAGILVEKLTADRAFEFNGFFEHVSRVDKHRTIF